MIIMASVTALRNGMEWIGVVFLPISMAKNGMNVVSCLMLNEDYDFSIIYGKCYVFLLVLWSGDGERISDYGTFKMFIRLYIKHVSEVFI